jgi:hypothetical protein
VFNIRPPRLEQRVSKSQPGAKAMKQTQSAPAPATSPIEVAKAVFGSHPEDVINPIKTESAPDGIPDIAHAVEYLWERSADNLTEDELKWFAHSFEHVGVMNRNLTAVVEGIGSFVCFDEKEKGGVNVGCFQSAHDVPKLLFFIAESLKHIDALTTIGDSATHRVICPQYNRELAEARKKWSAA